MKLASRKTEIARYVREPRLRGFFAGSALAMPYFEPRKFDYLITADHKVLDEDSESRNNHRYAIVVQYVATQRIQCYPWKTKKFTGDGKESTKVSRAVGKL